MKLTTAALYLTSSALFFAGLPGAAVVVLLAAGAKLTMDLNAK